jgi:predicted amidohydrolase YtcJ
MSELEVSGCILSFDLGVDPFSSLLIQHGKVAELSRHPLPARMPRLEINAGVVVPAFLDSHVHILEFGLQYIFPDLTPAHSLEEVFESVLARRKQADEFGFLIGFNLEPDNLPEKRLPLRRELDRLIANRPVMLYRTDGHSASVNTRGLELAQKGGIEAGLELDRFRTPTGILAGKAYEQASQRFKRLFPAELHKTAFRRACLAATRRGVLAIGALLGTDEPGDEAPELLAALQPELPIVAVIFPQTRSIKRARRLGLSRIGGCILIDGSFGSHTAALTEEYADEPGAHGRLYLTDAELESFLGGADEAGLQTAVHAIGDRAVNQVVSCHERLLTGNTLRHRIEHAELLDDALIERIARLGLVLGVQPAFERCWGGKDGLYERRLGPRFRRTNPYRQLLDAGVLLAGGSDAPITPVDPCLGIRAAVNHPVSEHRVTRLEACRMFTDRAAFSLGLESEKGSLTPGHDADFVVLSANPLECDEFQVQRVFKGGIEVPLH